MLECRNNSVGVKGNALEWFSGDAARVLELYTVAAARGVAMEADAFLAASQNAPRVNELPPQTVRQALRCILNSGRPEAAAVLAGTGALTAFGLAAPKSCTELLREAPQSETARWWVLAQLCGAGWRKTAERLCFPASLQAELQLYAQWEHRAPPASRLALKELLRRAPALDYPAMAAVFARQDSAWRGQENAWETLCASGEAWREDQLAVTAGDLRLLGLRGSRTQRMMERLLDAVVRAPELNRYDILCALAKGIEEGFCSYAQTVQRFCEDSARQSAQC